MLERLISILQEGDPEKAFLKSIVQESDALRLADIKTFAQSQESTTNRILGRLSEEGIRCILVAHRMEMQANVCERSSISEARVKKVLLEGLAWTIRRAVLEDWRLNHPGLKLEPDETIGIEGLDVIVMLVIQVP